jgi:hypothetical protein
MQLTIDSIRQRFDSLALLGAFVVLVDTVWGAVAALGLDLSRMNELVLAISFVLGFPALCSAKTPSVARQPPFPGYIRGAARPSQQGFDYGNPRFGMNTFDFIMQMLLQPQQEQVTSKICFTGDGGQQVCQ